MRAWLLHPPGDRTGNGRPLSLEEIPDPLPGPGELLVQVSACGVCHTELDEIEGRTPPPRYPVVLGHQVVGRVVAAGPVGDASPTVAIGDRVGVAWIFDACGRCELCREGLENLCPDFRATGRDANGGYAELMTVPTPFAHALPEGIPDVSVAPLLCAGAIGFRSLRLTAIEDGGRLGMTGFGASGHLMMQLVRGQMPETDVFVFARSPEQRAFALELGAAWAGGPDDRPSVLLDAVVDTTPAWGPVVRALEVLRPGGRLVVNAIRKESADQNRLLELDYARHLWMEKEIKSVANVTRRDVSEFLDLAVELDLAPHVEVYGMEDANRALRELKEGGGRGAKVLSIG